MKQKLLYALDCMKKYNTGIMYRECFGFEPDVEHQYQKQYHTGYDLSDRKP